MSATRRGGSQGDEASTTKVVGMLMLAIAGFGWAFMAAAYAHEKQGWRQESTNLTEPDADGIQYDQRFEDGGGIRQQSGSSLWDFIGNAFRQLPNLFGVLAFSFQHRLWLVILIACLEVGALGLGYAMSKID
ncbi:hypothetical protein [Gimesia sp.]|uniref:hypothetical protein n=1 Tax=Gimesia sp. TaxID=2024833 RepID=UPI0032EBCB7C